MSMEYESAICYTAPISNIEDFISRPFNKIEVGKSLGSPDIQLLKWLPTLTYEVAIVYQHPIWSIIKSGQYIPNWIIPEFSTIFLHSHPTISNSLDQSLPSIPDLINCSNNIKNLIISEKGITHFWRFDPNIIGTRIRNRIPPEIENSDDQLRALARIGANFKIYPWQKINDDSLQKLFCLDD